MDSITEQFFDDAFGKTVELGNKLAEKHDNADLWDIADGLLAGAIQYWLYAPRGAIRGRERVLPLAIRFQRRPRLKVVAAKAAAGAFPCSAAE